MTSASEHTISVVIGTYGHPDWHELAWTRAQPSVKAQTRVEPPEIHVQHEDTLAQARNLGSWASHARYLCFLDADDELAPGYLHAMQTAIRRRSQAKTPLLFTPRVEYITRRRGKPDRHEEPMYHPEVKPEDGNWLVIGTVVPHDLFDQVGGFEEWPMYEDWALFARMQEAGARVVRVPRAVYRAYRNPTGRNHQGPNKRRETFDSIRAAIWPDKYGSEEAA